MARAKFRAVAIRRQAARPRGVPPATPHGLTVESMRAVSVRRSVGHQETAYAAHSEMAG
jgi:hypothetical protein